MTSITEVTSFLSYFLHNCCQLSYHRKVRVKKETDTRRYRAEVAPVFEGAYGDNGYAPTGKLEPSVQLYKNNSKTYSDINAAALSSKQKRNNTIATGARRGKKKEAAVNNINITTTSFRPLEAIEIDDGLLPDILYQQQSRGNDAIVGLDNELMLHHFDIDDHSNETFQKSEFYVSPIPLYNGHK